MKKSERKLQHNIGTHKEKMIKRRATQNLRARNTIFKDSSKYMPSYEDRKHNKKV